MAATYVDASTVSVVAPPRAAAGLAHVAVSNDGATYTSLPAVRAGGAGTYLDFEFVGHAPWGPWLIDNATLSGVGATLVEAVSLLSSFTMFFFLPPRRFFGLGR